MSKARDLANAGTALTTVSATELGYLDGVTSAVQTQLNAKEPTLPSQTGNSGKYLTTDGTNKSWGTLSVPSSYSVYADKTGTATIAIPSGTYTYLQYGATQGFLSNTGITFGASGVSTLSAISSISIPQVANWTSRAINYNDTTTGAVYGGGVWAFCTNGDKISTSTDLTTWTSRTSTFSGSAIRAITYGSGTFVAVGDGGKLATSTDGATWTSRTSGFGTNIILCVAHNGSNLFVAGGISGGLRTSPDGATWTTRTSQFGTGNVYGVAYNGSNLWVAVGSDGKISTSPDGTTWTSRSSGTTNNFLAVTYGNGIWVAVGDANQIRTSTDGITWTSRYSGGSTNQAVTFGNGQFMVVGTNGVALSSTDGITWVSRTVTGWGNSEFAFAHFANSIFVIGGQANNLTFRSSALGDALPSATQLVLTGYTSTSIA